MIDSEFESKVRDAVRQIGKDIQKDHSDRVDAYRRKVKKIQSAVKAFDGFLLRTAKKQKKKQNEQIISKTIPGK
jgi:hypothetical protein